MCEPDGHDHANGFNEAINMQRVRVCVTQRQRLTFTLPEPGRFTENKALTLGNTKGGLWFNNRKTVKN